VIVGPCLFQEDAALSKYQAVNDPNKPLAAVQTHESDKALLRLALALRQHASERGNVAGVSSNVAHAALRESSQGDRLSTRILALIQRLQSGETPLSGCVSEALGIALDTHDAELRSLCQQELVGYAPSAGPGIQPMPNAKDAPHRVLEFHVSLGVEVNIDFFGSGGAAIEYMRQRPQEFPRLKLLFPEPIAQVESHIARSTPERLLRLTMPAGSIVPATNIPDATVFLYASGDALRKVVDGLRTALTTILFKKLEP
jgi:hypothetical protein